MKFDKILSFAKRTALKLVAREIARILAKADVPKDVAKDVKLEALEDGVALEGKDLKARAVTDAAVRNIAR